MAPPRKAPQVPGAVLDKPVQAIEPQEQAIAEPAVQDEFIDPTKLSRAVLTPLGWICPA